MQAKTKDTGILESREIRENSDSEPFSCNTYCETRQQHSSYQKTRRERAEDCTKEPLINCLALGLCRNSWFLKLRIISLKTKPLFLKE